nr:sigma-70 family RNA polymerase sigma factor [Alkalihalobacterium bogoriense]
MEKAKAGNKQAFRLIVTTYRDHIFKTVYSVLRNQKDAEDAAQEVFLKVYHALPQYQGNGFKTWMTTIAVRYAIDVKRKLAKVEHEEINQQEVDDKTSVEEEVITKEKVELIRRRLQDVPVNYRDVLIDFYIHEKSYKQMATEHNVEVKTIETKLYRARHWVKRNWKEEEFK